MFDYQVLVVDDEDLSRESTVVSLELYIPPRNIHPVDGIRAAKEVLASTGMDLAILDISMQEENGFQLAEYIHNAYPAVPYIFLTGYPQFALAGYRYQPMGFLIKPVDAAALGELLEKVRPERMRGERREQRIGISFGGGFRVLDVDNILFVEKAGRSIVIHFQDGETLIPQYSLERILAILQDHDFVRVHQSFIVALQAIEMVTANPYGSAYEITLKGTHQKIPLSRTNYTKLRERIQANHPFL